MLPRSVCAQAGLPPDWPGVQDLVDAASAVEAAIDKGVLAAWLARKTPEEGPGAAKTKVMPSHA